MATSFTLTRGSVAGIGYGIVRNAIGEDVATAVWTESTKRWRNIEMDDRAMRCNRTRQAACKCLRSVEGIDWAPEHVCK
jgi:hypothetical protein